MMRVVDNDSLNDVQVLLRVPELPIVNSCGMSKRGLIIDLETTGLDYKSDKITEIGIIQFAYQKDVQQVTDIYSRFNDPKIVISDKITKLTGINNAMVKGHSIDWLRVSDLVSNSEIILCHNAAFDRKFLEMAAPHIFNDALFGCTKNDIDWARRGYGATKLDYLNWKLGFFYDGHRAINDCWATLNLLNEEEGAFKELINNCEDETEIYALDAPYSTKEQLKRAGFRWNPGDNNLPKSWWIKVKGEEELSRVKSFLNNEIGCRAKQRVIPANKKYSIGA